MNEQTANRYDEPKDEWPISAERDQALQASAQSSKMCSFEQTALRDPEKISENLMDVAFCFRRRHDAIKVTMNSIRQPAEPKPEVVECALVELLEIAQRHGITPADFIQLLDSGMHISDFLAAMTPIANSNGSIDCDS